MYARQITNEETYTLAEARRIINAEQSRKKEVLFRKAKQKLLGFSMVLLGVIELTLGYLNIIDEGGVFLGIPFGIYIMLTKENIL